MHLSLWILAGLTILVNLPAIALYGIPEARAWRTDRRRAAAPLYVVARSAALVVAAIVATALCAIGLPAGWLLGIGLATALVQLFDVPVAAYAGDRGVAGLAGVAAIVEGAAVVFAWIMTGSA